MFVADSGVQLGGRVMTSSTEYTPEKLQRMLADVISSRFPLSDVSLLLRAGADADGPVTRGLRPLHYAAYENDVQVEMTRF